MATNVALIAITSEAAAQLVQESCNGRKPNGVIQQLGVAALCSEA